MLWSKIKLRLELNLNPLTLVGDQDRIFFVLHLYNVMQTGDENKEKYQLWNY